MRRMRAATYRVQLHAGFTFDDAAAVVDYLAALGVSHLYCSPYLHAAKGSTHGYDVIDHGRLNDELGGPAAHSRLVSRAAARAGSRELEHLAAAYGRLPLASLTDPADVEERHRGKEELRARLGELSGAEPEVAAAIDAEIEDLNRDPDALDALLSQQNYRLASWRTAAQELSYRPVSPPPTPPP